jgi:hypothetical protein
LIKPFRRPGKNRTPRRECRHWRDSGGWHDVQTGRCSEDRDPTRSRELRLRP